MIIKISKSFKQFIIFGLVGIVGFVVDSVTLTLLVLILHTAPYIMRACSYLTAATTTWALNRIFTFSSNSRSTNKIKQWLRFIFANAPGAILNYLVFVLILYLFKFKTQQLWIPVGIGSLSGLLVNFNLSRIFVFQDREITDSTIHPELIKRRPQ